MNRTLLDMVRYIISLAKLIKSFLGLCTGDCCLSVKQSSIKSVDVAPYEIWCNKKPILSYMRVWDAQHIWRGLCQISLMTNLTNIYLWGILRKLKDTTSTILWNKGVCFKACRLLKERVSLKWRQVGVKLNLMKFMTRKWIWINRLIPNLLHMWWNNRLTYWNTSS